MGTYFDRFAKDLFQEVLAPLGEVQVEVEVSAPPQRIDVLLLPAPGREEARRALGLLGRMGEGPCLIEVFRRTPEVERVRECVRKHLNHWHTLGRRGVEARAPALWVLSTGRPEGAMAVFGLARLRGWPSGVYGGAAGLRVRLVVISELPRERSTLLLRLMGAGEVQKRAIEELQALPVDAWERRQGMPLVLRLCDQLGLSQVARTDEEEEFIVNIQEWYESYKQELRDEVRAEGLQRMFARRIGRALSEAEKKILEERIRVLGLDAIEDLVLDGTSEGLRRWLAEPIGDAG